MHTALINLSGFQLTGPTEEELENLNEGHQSHSHSPPSLPCAQKQKPNTMFEVYNNFKY